MIAQADNGFDSAGLMPDIPYTIANSSITVLLSVSWLLPHISLPQLWHSIAPPVLLYLSDPAASSVAEPSFSPVHPPAIYKLVPFELILADSIQFVFSIWLLLLQLFVGSAGLMSTLPLFLHFLARSSLGSLGPIELDLRYCRIRSHLLVVRSLDLELLLILPFRSFQRPVMLSWLRCLPGPF